MFCGYLPDKGSERHQTEADLCFPAASGQEMGTKLPDMLEGLGGGGWGESKLKAFVFSSDSGCRCSCDDTLKRDRSVWV